MNPVAVLAAPYLLSFTANLEFPQPFVQAGIEGAVAEGAVLIREMAGIVAALPVGAFNALLQSFLKVPLCLREHSIPPELLEA